MIGPLVDDGAPFSAICFFELTQWSIVILTSFDGVINPIPEILSGLRQWQNGSGTYASAPRNILCSINLTFRTDGDNEVDICYLVLDGSSQWVIGRNVTSPCDIIHGQYNALLLYSNSSAADTFSLIDHEFHCFVPLSQFQAHAQMATDSTSYALSALSSTLSGMPISLSKKPIDTSVVTLY